MKPPSGPRLDKRRAKEFEAELFARARAWIPSWSMDDNERDFGRAMLKIAARFSSVVAERLDRTGEKMRLGFLDWLAVQGEAARPAHLPVVFKLTDSARRAVLASQGTRLQVEAAGKPVILETEKDVYLLPGALKTLIGVDADEDAFFLPPPGLSSLAPLEPLPTQWRLKSFASTGATKLQLDPELGLSEGMLVEIGGQQYRLEKVDKDLVTIDPPLSQDQAEGSVANKVTAFAPFDGAAHNQQQHVLYLGHKELFNIESAATIEIVGATALKGIVSWHYWGKKAQSDEVTWQELPLASEEQQTSSDALVLNKPNGSMEILELVKGSESRWIRASVGSLPVERRQPLRVDTFAVRVNCKRGFPPCPLVAGTADDLPPAPTAEAMSNTTPLVLDTTFFPLGKEPRQFDAFYLGSKEAFSKKGANVQLCFEMADTTFATLSVVSSGTFANKVVAGVAQDGALHLLQVDATTGLIGKFREALRPQSADANAGSSVMLNPRPAGRLPVWNDADDADGFLVAASAGGDVWVWRENSSQPTESKWIAFNSAPSPTAATSPPEPISDLVFLAGALFALRGGQLSSRQWPAGPQWTPVPTTGLPAGIVLEAIVPVLVKSLAGALETSAAAGMLGVASDKRPYRVTVGGVCSPLLPNDVEAAVRPVAVLEGANLTIALAHRSLGEIFMFRSGAENPLQLKEPKDKATGFQAVISDGDLYFLAAVQSSAGDYLASWKPPNTTELFRSHIPAGTPAGAPAAIAGQVLVPGTSGDLLVAPFNLKQRFALQADVGQGIVTPSSAPALQPNDMIAVESINPPFETAIVTTSGATFQGETFYPLNRMFTPGSEKPLWLFRAADQQRNGTPTGVSDLNLDPLDTHTAQDDLLQIGNAVHRVTRIIPGPIRQATVDPAPPQTTTVPYRNAVSMNGRLAPFMPLDASNNGWDAALLDHSILVFPGADPSLQTGKAFTVGSGNRPSLVVLNSPWKSGAAPAAAASFVLDAAVGAWARSAGDTSTNPELSWEYWNGAGWWKIGGIEDRTLHLKNSGKLQFKVPPDLSPTDWSGRTNYWIRARLIGGDYGREKVTVAISPPGRDGVTHQTIERSSRDIHAPAVVKLTISYNICEDVLPNFVLTKDSGSFRDQSEANRTAGAKVEAFVPVSVLLGRLSGRPVPATADDCRTDCNCPSTTASGTAASAPAVPLPAAPSDASSPASGRALYIGFDAPLSGAPVNLLFLVDQERHHDSLAPMTIEALVADRFVPIVTSDATRALGESGLLSLAFAIEPTPRELFGQPLKWLRLMPSAANPGNDWLPAIRGAYLNAAWASAAETVTRELLGSSQGEPRLTLNLSKPPVLHDTLELRVKEPLGEEERDALNAQKKDQVLSTVQNLPGDWVLWRRVIDPDDEAPTERVYALDESSGEIVFGDGRHGKIPPIGRDSIMAFTYRRTEAGEPGSAVVPGNAIAARTSLNLVSPVESVEAVFAADQAAGGAPAENTERVLRFGVARLRHRERALTAQDIEDIALESSPDIVQARCFPRNGFVNMVLVMRGTNPTPSSAQVRELSRLLLAVSPPSLNAPHALRIEGPIVRRLRVDLRLRVESLDDAGQVARDAKQQIIALFDTLTGGPDEDGWPLGENPAEADIAMALADIPNLFGIAEITLREVDRDGTDRPWPSLLKRNEMAMVDRDVIRAEFQIVGEAA